ncbi:hypothetical protein BBD42_17845 [Paenibacillus sp. BIHB 4019]|uniref:Uncharacterized protein n=1 Tax=Paenibacillus sp. BIHB 4019 TaxID=1870819 RepID=A0A1B2DK98_9BACL|nr:hypothetical protein BBD42_17845 [Paenibacillus sp. BIHB 4019]
MAESTVAESTVAESAVTEVTVAESAVTEVTVAEITIADGAQLGNTHCFFEDRGSAIVAYYSIPGGKRTGKPLWLSSSRQNGFCQHISCS